MVVSGGRKQIITARRIHSVCLFHVSYSGRAAHSALEGGSFDGKHGKERWNSFFRPTSKRKGILTLCTRTKYIYTEFYKYLSKALTMPLSSRLLKAWAASWRLDLEAGRTVSRWIWPLATWAQDTRRCHNDKNVHKCLQMFVCRQTMCPVAGAGLLSGFSSGCPTLVCLASAAGKWLAGPRCQLWCS